ncbi:hypothetical protein LTS08_008260 [Lithohypha guttulata]|uniref:Metal homeostatis protein bsd2 n=1 Tax=Lithohypha guttulata TaxID=1690604 RepID=A0AAN7T1M7_9EURO|nr:hypothetical protein LTR05_004022 [Lithohypha guttulata]KAK5095100.1 hypothetical protein LTS08_008260 [Lithohypha guttulata]
MSPQRYAAVNQQDDHDDNETYNSPTSPSSNQQHAVPSSPPPSFHSRASSPSSRRLLRQDPLNNAADHELADAFGDDGASDDENEPDDRQRLMRADTSRSISLADTGSAAQAPTATTDAPRIERRVTEIPAFRLPTSSRVIPGVTAPRSSDGVFANMSAKPAAGETLDDKPPSYEAAASDSAPPYWETTILAPGMNSDEIYVNGLPVGSVFSFIWNGMISMSFLFPGFLLTYLLHTTHAAKNGSLAGLGLTLVQYGFYMRTGKDAANPDAANPGQFSGGVSDPNSHDFDPNNPTGNGGDASGGSGGFGSADFISYALMICGWFLLIRAVSGFLRARREEQLVLQSPARGLSQPVVAEGEGERAV